MIKVAGSLVHHILVVLCTLLFLQFPLFFQSYQHQLIGHVAEIERHVKQMRQTAAMSGKSLDQYIHKFISNSDADFSRQGEAMQQMHKRSQHLALALRELNSAHIFTRPYVFLIFIDWDIAKSTARAFQPGIPLTMEGFYYGFLGLILGCLLFSVRLLLWTFGSSFRS